MTYNSNSDEYRPSNIPPYVGSHPPWRAKPQVTSPTTWRATPRSEPNGMYLQLIGDILYAKTYVFSSFYAILTAWPFLDPCDTSQPNITVALSRCRLKCGELSFLWQNKTPPHSSTINLVSLLIVIIWSNLSLKASLLRCSNIFSLVAAI